MEFVIVWIGCAVACYFVAKSKGRNAGGWAVAGFFFSLIALLIVALLPKRHVFQNPQYAQPVAYGTYPQYGQQLGYGGPPQHVVQQSYPHYQAPPPIGAAPAPHVVPPPIHPQHRSPQPAASSVGPEQQQVVGSVSVELARLGAMHRSGQMSDSDFEAAKRRLLGK